MRQFFSVTRLFIFLNIWHFAQAIEVLHAIPEDALSTQFSRVTIKTGMEQGVVVLKEHLLTEGDQKDIERSVSYSTEDVVFKAISEQDRSALYKLYCSEHKSTVRGMIEGTIDSLLPDNSFISMITHDGTVKEEADISLLLDLVEGRTFFPTLVMDLSVHKCLARLSSDGSPLAQWYLAKVLNHFSVKEGDFLALASQSLRYKATESFLLTIDKVEMTSSLKGLYSEYLGDESKAEGFFKEGVINQEAFSHYKIAERKEQLGQEDALNYYEIAFILGYEKALTDIGRHHDDENSSFLMLKKAGMRGNAESYFLIAKMIREGFRPLQKIEGWENEEYWLEEGLKKGSLSSGITLGKLYEDRKNFDAAKRVYSTLVPNIRATLEFGKMERERYRDAAWFGLYELAAITPIREEKEFLRKEAGKIFRSHFQEIIDIARIY